MNRQRQKQKWPSLLTPIKRHTKFLSLSEKLLWIPLLIFFPLVFPPRFLHTEKTWRFTAQHHSLRVFFLFFKVTLFCYEPWLQTEQSTKPRKTCWTVKECKETWGLREEGREKTPSLRLRASSKEDPGSLETRNCRLGSHLACASFPHWREKPTGGSTSFPPVPKFVQEVAQLSTQPQADKQDARPKLRLQHSQSQELCLPEVLRGSSISFSSDALSVDKSKLTAIKRQACDGEFCWPFSDWIWPQHRTLAIAEMID